jgi:hypothetical protein
MRIDPVAEAWCKEKDPSLPADWEIYAFECVGDENDSFTHAKVTGSVPGVYVKGPRKGQKKWGVNPSKTFILDLEELAKRQQTAEVCQ